MSSLLVTGDLEERAFNRLTSFYSTGSLLDTDVLVEGHYGSRNGVTPDLVRFASPKVGVISCGRWDDGKDSTNRLNTYHFGHPNRDSVGLLAGAVWMSRSPKQVMVGVQAAEFEETEVNKAVDCTGWDGSIVIDAYADGRLEVRPRSLVGTSHSTMLNRPKLRVATRRRTVEVMHTY